MRGLVTQSNLSVLHNFETTLEEHVVGKHCTSEQSGLVVPTRGCLKVELVRIVVQTYLTHAIRASSGNQLLDITDSLAIRSISVVFARGAPFFQSTKYTRGTNRNGRFVTGRAARVHFDIGFEHRLHARGLTRLEDGCFLCQHRRIRKAAVDLLNLARSISMHGGFLQAAIAARTAPNVWLGGAAFSGIWIARGDGA